MNICLPAIQFQKAYDLLEQDKIIEADLVGLIKNCRNTKLKVGRYIGIISYNETPLKEILLGGTSVISTDHSKMSETAARLILEKREEKIRNAFSMIIRKSL